MPLAEVADPAVALACRHDGCLRGALGDAVAVLGGVGVRELDDLGDDWPPVDVTAQEDPSGLDGQRGAPELPELVLSAFGEVDRDREVVGRSRPSWSKGGSPARMTSMISSGWSWRPVRWSMATSEASVAASVTEVGGALCTWPRSWGSARRTERTSTWATMAISARSPSEMRCWW